MGQELNEISLAIGITASVLYITSEIIAWSKCKSNSVSQFILHNFVCSVEEEEPAPPVSDVEMVCVCDSLPK